MHINLIKAMKFRDSRKRKRKTGAAFQSLALPTFPRRLNVSAVQLQPESFRCQNASQFLSPARTSSAALPGSTGSRPPQSCPPSPARERNGLRATPFRESALRASFRPPPSVGLFPRMASLQKRLKQKNKKTQKKKNIRVLTL